MRKLSILTSIFVAVFFLTASFAQAEIKKVGYLDLSRIFDSYQKTKEYDKVLEEQYNKYDAERNAKVEKIQEKQGKRSLLKEEDQKKADEEIQNMVNDLQQYDMAQRTDLTKKRDERIREILLEVEQIVGTYAKKEGFDMIFNDRVLIYGSEGMDITDKILEILNASYKK